MVSIRAADKGEVSQLAEIGFRSWERAMLPVGESRAMIANARAAFVNFTRSASRTLTVIEHAGRPIGWAAREALDERLTDFWIDPDYQGRGFGTLLLADVEDSIRRAGFDDARLETHAKNQQALRFFQKHGYGVHWLSVVYNPKLDRDVQTVGLTKRLVVDEAMTYGPGGMF